MSSLLDRGFVVDRAVFIPSIVFLLSTVGIVLAFPEASDAAFGAMQGAIVENASWFYGLVMAILLVTSVVLAFSRVGNIRLGPDNSSPDYSLFSWLSMLFAAGVGIGLMFYGVSEPVVHFLNPPVGEGLAPGGENQAINLTMLHWGFNAWSVYALMALVLAYFSFRRCLPLTLRSAFYPILGDRIYGPIGAAIDVFAIVCTTFGISTSLGLGVEQLSTGLNYLFNVPESGGIKLAITIAIMAMAAVSVALGLDTCIKRLSEINTVLAVLLLALILIAGQTALLLSGTLQNFGGYVASLIPKTLDLYVYAPSDWLGGWTIFYWGWWISWTPFVGVFVARISRGRTIREFLVGVTVVPTLFICLWIGVLGGSAIELISNQGVTELGTAVQENQAVGLFMFLEYLPGTELLSLICLAIIVIFFVTSADSGAMVLNMLSARGNDNTPVLQRTVWTLVIALIASILLVGGGLQALQTATIASALPFSVALLGAFWGFGKALLVDGAKRQVVPIHPPVEAGDPEWRQRLANLLAYPADASVQSFERDVVFPAMQSFAEELNGHGIRTQIGDHIAEEGILRLEVAHGEEIDFVYQVNLRGHPLPDQSLSGKSLEDMKQDQIF